MRHGSPPRIARVIPPHDALVAELAELIAIPSVSADDAHADDVRRAADWVAERIRRAGGTVEIAERGGRPLVIGEVKASTGDAPTVLVYAHLDVQPPDPLELWDTDPWALEERNGSLVARGSGETHERVGGGHRQRPLWRAHAFGRAGRQTHRGLENE